MNWLAHLILSEDHIDYQLGNVLADPLKGRSWVGASVQLQQGMKMHAGIDAFTDSHELVVKSKSRLGAGCLKGVIVDLAYDYLLVKNWHSFVIPDLHNFLQRFYEDARLAAANYPEQASGFVLRLIDSEHLGSYGSLEGLQAAFSRLDSRLSPRVSAKETAMAYLPVIEERMAGLEQDFLQFFPQLIHFFKSHCVSIEQHHWLK